MHNQLKIKVMSLAAEARIIRAEEKRLKKANRRLIASGKTDQMTKEDRDAYLGKRSKVINDLHSHRIAVVRPAARHSLLAYGFLRGKKYCEIESKVRVSLCETEMTNGRNTIDIVINTPDWKEVGKNVSKFDWDHDTAKFAAWLAAAKQHIEELKEAA